MWQLPSRTNTKACRRTQHVDVMLQKTSGNCGEINNLSPIIMIVNGFRDGTKADNMVRMKSPSVSVLSREIVLHYFLSLFWSL